jgi:hypothetical protein
VLDQGTNNISLFDILEEISIETPTFINFSKTKRVGIPIEIDIVSLWEKKEDGALRAATKIEYLAPNNELLNEINAPVEIATDKKRLRSIIRMRGLTITGPGTYFLIIKYQKHNKWLVAARIPLDIKIVQTVSLPATKLVP